VKSKLWAVNLSIANRAKPSKEILKMQTSRIFRRGCSIAKKKPGRVNIATRHDMRIPVARKNKRNRKRYLTLKLAGLFTSSSRIRFLHLSKRT
jgi:hypothetical protein